MSEKARVAETPDKDPRKDDGEHDPTIFNQDGLEIHGRAGDRVMVHLPKFPASVTDARELRDALDEYIEDEDYGSAAFPNEDTIDTSLTVDVDADVSAASEAIESLQTDMEALNEELNEAAERVEDIDIGSLDFGLPAPSPSDVQARMDETDEREMVPAEPLYELAEMWAGVRVTEPYGDKRAKSYRKARKESGEWLKEELDELTGSDDA